VSASIDFEFSDALSACFVASARCGTLYPSDDILHAGHDTGGNHEDWDVGDLAYRFKDLDFEDLDAGNGRGRQRA